MNAEIMWAAVCEAPLWVWSGVAAFCAWVAMIGLWLQENRRAVRWENAAHAAQAEARGWRALAGYDEAQPFGKRTVVAPRFHAPRAGSSVGG
jgi:hypothetical protein